MRYVLALLAAAAFAPALAASATAQFAWGCEERVGDFCVSAAKKEFTTDFSKASIDLGEIKSGGPPKDGIPSIDDPVFKPVGEIDDIAPTEPVIGMIVNGDWKAYPLRILMFHEITNDVIGGVPVSVTFCPLCNAAIAFDRRVDGKVLDFGTTGRLRKSDLLMYDRQTESWWQQFMGEAVVGEMTGAVLNVLPARLESFESFKARAPADALVQVPNDPGMRPYGANPYDGYDGSAFPFLYDGEVPEGIKPLARVVALAGKTEAWALDLLRREGEITTSDGTVLRWTPGQNSALDTYRIDQGKDVGNVTATRDGEDVPYFVDFAFAFHAFRPNAPIHLAAP
jgi:hypothetical protein